MRRIFSSLDNAAFAARYAEFQKMPWNYDLCAKKRVLRLPLNRLDRQHCASRAAGQKRLLYCLLRCLYLYPYW